MLVRRQKQTNNTDNNLRPDQNKFDEGDVYVTDIELVEGRTHKYTIGIGTDRINFKFTPSKVGTISLIVSELEGRVNTTVVSFQDSQQSKR